MIAPGLPELQASPRDGPKPISHWPVFEGMLWILRTDARGQDLPARFPSPSTCWRRLRDGEEQGVWLRPWRAFLAQLDAWGPLDGAAMFADDRVVPAKKGRGGWWWLTAKVGLWETSWRRRPQPRWPWRRETDAANGVLLTGSLGILSLS